MWKRLAGLLARMRLLTGESGANSKIVVTDAIVEKTYTTIYGKATSKFEYDTLCYLRLHGIPVPKVLEFDRSVPRLTLERVPGVSLFEFVRVATDSEIVKGIRNFANTLHLLHSIPFYHGDPNMHNEIVDQNGNITLIDFQVPFGGFRGASNAYAREQIWTGDPLYVDIAIAFLSIRQSFGPKDILSRKGEAMAELFLQAYSRNRIFSAGEYLDLLRSIRSFAKIFFEDYQRSARQELLVAGYFFFKYLELWFFVNFHLAALNSKVNPSTKICSTVSSARVA